MPPKRRSSGLEATGASKKARVDSFSESSDTSSESSYTSSESSSANPPAVFRSDRWAPVSNCRNIYADLEAFETLPNAYDFVCKCHCPYLNSDTFARTPKPASSDDGKACLCNKAASEHKTHVWKFTRAGLHRFSYIEIMCAMRDVYLFAVVSEQVHDDYGMLEVVQNLILDIDEALPATKEDDWRPMWAVAEATALFFASGKPMLMLGENMLHGRVVVETTRLVLRMINIALVVVDLRGLLDKGAEGGPPNVADMTGLLLTVLNEFAMDFNDMKMMEDMKLFAQACAHSRAGVQPAGPARVEKLVAEAKKLALGRPVVKAKYPSIGTSSLEGSNDLWIAVLLLLEKATWHSALVASPPKPGGAT